MRGTCLLRDYETTKRRRAVLLLTVGGAGDPEDSCDDPPSFMVFHSPGLTFEMEFFRI